MSSSILANTAAPAAPAAAPEQTPETIDSTGGSGYIVVVYDNDHNTYEEVTGILMQATGCPLEEAEMETWEVDNLGKSVVHHAGREECERAAAVIRTIGIRVEVVEA